MTVQLEPTRLSILDVTQAAGMSVTDMQTSFRLLAGGAETHGERMTLLLEHPIKVRAPKPDEIRRHNHP